ncbi:HD-GYP domain-containing protein [Marinobacterium sedimentorum]|uniref:HD-GYP domain-containing protein n=1 Tax=Marinobacterium sedimentorum TaxID=2927804 RepID=UPI0020C5EB99|nr:HD domain-containing phosphohydrolase [Marinobacterium sedimentorum]MCP8688048.1 HD domain-containing protein [Marinobacterium sedimentorum]
MEALTERTSDQLEKFLQNVFACEGAEGIINCLSFLFGSFALTCEGKIVACSHNFALMAGYRREELYGMNASDLIAVDFRPDLHSRLSLDVTERYSSRLLTKSGAQRHVIISPRLFSANGTKFRLAEFIDQTDVLLYQQSQVAMFHETASALTCAIEQRDPYTNGHMSRTTRLSIRIAELMTLDQKTTDLISLGSSLHDIGKISVPIEILNKPSKLEPYEWEFIKQHPEKGHRILAGVNCEKLVKDIVLLHHESQDGSGYPYGLQKDEIPLGVAIVTVADCLEAIAGVRPYRRAHSFNDAIAIMEHEAHKFHPDVFATARYLVKSGEITGTEFSAYND